MASNADSDRSRILFSKKKMSDSYGYYFTNDELNNAYNDFNQDILQGYDAGRQFNSSKLNNASKEIFGVNFKNFSDKAISEINNNSLDVNMFNNALNTIDVLADHINLAIIRSDQINRSYIFLPSNRRKKYEEYNELIGLASLLHETFIQGLHLLQSDNNFSTQKSKRSSLENTTAILKLLVSSVGELLENKDLLTKLFKQIEEEYVTPSELLDSLISDLYDAFYWDEEEY